MPTNFSVAVTIRAIDEVTKTINRVTSNISKQSSSVKALGQNLALATPPRHFTQAAKDLGAEISGITKSSEMKRFITDVELGTKRAVTGFRLLGSAAKDVFSVLATSGVVIGGLSFASNRLFTDVSRSNIELKHAATQLNTTPDQLRSYRLAAESTGVAQGAIDSAFSRINDMAFQFKVGNTAPAQSIAALNSIHQGTPISLLDEHKRQRSPELILGEFFEKLKTSHLPQVTKVQFMNDFLGNADLLPLASLGRKGFHEKASQFQGEDYKESDQATEKYLQATTQFNTSLDKLKRLASIEILPGISKGLEGISNWIKEHGQSLRTLFKDIGEGIPREMSSALWWINGLVKGLTLLSNTLGIANFAFLTMGLTIGVKFYKAWQVLKPIQALCGIGAKLKMVWSGVEVAFSVVEAAVVALTSPMGLLVASIAMIVGAFVTLGVVIYKNWSKIKEVFKSFKLEFKSNLEDIKKLIHGTIDSISQFMNPKKLQFSKVFSQFKVGQESIKQNETNYEKKNLIPNYNKPVTRLKDNPTPAEVTVRFENLPKGARIDEPRGTSWVNLFAGYSSVGESA